VMVCDYMHKQDGAYSEGFLIRSNESILLPRRALSS
jgi:hypothetical protein